MSGAVVYNSSFIYFDDAGEVHGLSNVLSDQYKNFEIDTSLIEDFFLNKKNFKNYNIDYFFNLSKGVIELEEEQTVIESNLSLYLIPRTSAYNNELTIDHDVKNSKWIITIRKDVVDKLDIISNLVFFVTKANDPYFLYRSFSVATNEIKDNVEINFNTEEENSLTNISLLTVKKFNSYGVKEIT